MVSPTSISREALTILAIAGAATAVLVGVRGLPNLNRPATDNATCSGPLPELPAVRWISPDAAVALLGRPDVAFVDTRDQAEYEAGHVAGALHSPMNGGALEPALLANLSGLSTVIAYCDASDQCARSSRFASMLSRSGFTDVRVLEGGISAWLDNGRPAESGECRQCQ